ncbi:MAG: hypothetical protein HY678_06745 [Chloroflexi bacterium]|nr:hypothetical protein [Chloroflexota bacterium]
MSQVRSAGTDREVELGAPGTRVLSILPGFGREILPALVLLWTGLIVAYLVTERDYLWAILAWATVTTIMLWPVGRRLGRSYFSYRSVGFVIGVISMAYIPFAGFGLMSDASFKVKSAIFFGLVFDLTALGILPGLRWFIGRPMGMFFRPDLLFGDGRVLATGILAIALGLRYIIGGPGPQELAWPLPNWNWYAIFFAMVGGLIPLIAVRGMTKLLMRMRRMRDGAWTGWAATVIREGLLVIAALSVGYGFHNAFLGADPFTVTIFVSDPDFWPALSIVLGAAFFLIFVRGGYKRAIGDPFIRETLTQSVVKQVLLVIGVITLFYGLMSMLSMDPMHTKMGVNGLRTWDNTARLWSVGVPIVAWGLFMLIAVRVIIQHWQRHAIVAQMASVILPSQKPPQRARLVAGMIAGLLQMQPAPRIAYLRTMNESLATATPEARAAVTQEMVGQLVSLPQDRRDALMRSQAEALGLCKPDERVTRMADMMGAVSELPEGQRQMMMRTMAALVG